VPVGAVAAAKRKTAKKTAAWSWRLAGIALCAFFALGVFAGLSRSGRSLAQRVEALLRAMPRLSATQPDQSGAAAAGRSAEGAIALVERGDGFYALDAAGGLRGPVSSAAESDLAIISGPGADAAGPELLGYARVMVQAEAALGLTVSEMRVRNDAEATLYLERPAIPVLIDPEDSAVELARATQILALWRGRGELIAALDLTIADQAVVRVRAGVVAPEKPANAARGQLTLTRLSRNSGKREAAADR
jgi:hypothetical protein